MKERKNEAEVQKPNDETADNEAAFKEFYEEDDYDFYEDSPDDWPPPEMLLRTSQDALVLFWDGILADRSAEWQKRLSESVYYPSERPVVMHGANEPKEPRDALWFGDPGLINLKYAATNRPALPWPRVVLEIRKIVYRQSMKALRRLGRLPKNPWLSGALINHYTCGRDYMVWYIPPYPLTPTTHNSHTNT